MSSRIAIVGWGKIAPKHAEVIRALGGEVTAAASRSEAGRAAAIAAGVKRVYPDVASLLEGEETHGLDGVVVCPAFPGVFAAAATVIERGVPALVEKPPGTSLAELDRLIAVQRASGSPVIVGLNRRHYSVFEAALGHAGGRDAITGVFVEWSEDPEHAMKTYPEEAVRRWVAGNTLHGLDLVTWLAGDCEAAQVTARSLGAPLRWQMGFQGISARGVFVNFSSTWDAPARWRLSFTASGRRYVFAPLETCAVLSRTGETHLMPSEEDTQFKPGFLRQARTFLDVIAGLPAPQMSLESVRPAMALAERLTAAVEAAG
jgi:predicted dehydrogenase